MAIDLSLIDEEHVTLTGLNLRSGPGASNKSILVMPTGTILWPQQKIPSWVNGKLVTQEGKSASDWVHVGVLLPPGSEERTDLAIGYCWIGTASKPTITSTKKDATV